MVVAALAVVLIAPASIAAHDGPPYPIVMDRLVGPYRLSIWTDPDTTDDGSPGGQFWVTLGPAGPGPLPPRTDAAIAIRPLDRPGPERRATATPVRGNVTNQFVALLMDHEGRFAVRLTVAGPAGEATVDSEVDATYDLRPPPYVILVYAMPFLLVGLLWARLILRRRVERVRAARSDPPLPVQ
jgi:hypothetical protein